MNHTPGPWTVASYDTADGDEGGTILHRITAPAARAAVADQVFTESDARLIAAAPAMADALQKALLHMLTGHKLADTDPEAAWAHIHKAEDIARAALAAAQIDTARD